MGSSKKATVGYRYYMGLHFGICHGPVDAIHKVSIGDRVAWTGEQTASGAIGINAPDLFGGDSREGGAVGVLDVMMGESTQGQNSYLASLIGSGIPGFRGILSAVWNGGQVASNNPYVKPWAFKVRRILNGWSGGSAWYPEAAIIGAGCTGDYVVSAFNETFDNGLADYSVYQGSLSGFSIVSDTYGSALRVAPGPNDLDAISRTVPSGKFQRVSVKFKVLSTGSDDYGVLDLRDGAGNVVFSLTAGRESTIDALRRPALDFYDAPGDPGNPVGSGAVTVGHWYQADFEYDHELQQFECSIVDINTSTPHGSVTVSISERTAISTVVWRTENVLGSGTVLWDELSLFIEVPGGATMNPAHIIYQCLTDTAWGMGYPTSSVDNTSFTAAADALYAESFGISLLWNRQEAIDAFIQIVLDHIGGMLYVQPDTGKFALKMIRDDYVRESLPQYGPENLISADNYQRQAWGETVNEVTVVFVSDCTEKEESVTVQDVANISVQSGVVAQTRNYPGVRNANLAQRVALRDLQAGSTPLASIKLTATRAAWMVFPGDVFRLTWPEYGIDDVVYRALSVNRGTLQDGQIIIEAVEDVFGLPENTYLVEQPGEWEDPSIDPSVAPYREMIEAPYWDLVRNLSAADMDYVDPLAGYLETLAVRPSGAAINYTVYTKVGAAAYEEAGNGDFCPSATIVGALTKTTTAIMLANGVDLDIVVAGGYAVIENEYVLVSAINWLAGTATISRGLLDTVPIEHGAGARIWFADAYQGFSTTEYADGETVDVKLLPVTGRGELDISLAPSDSLVFDQRQYRPYAPGKVLVNTSSYPEWIGGTDALALSWAHRDRLLQTAYLVEQSEASIGPEVGTTYNLRLYGELDDLLREETGLSGTSYTWSTELDDVAAGGTEDVYWSSVVSLLRFEGANNSTTITDDAAAPLSWSCVGGAKISTADYKFGSSSLVLDGSGDYVTTTGLTSLGSVWTAEIFVKSADLGSNVAKQVFQFINGSGYGFDVLLAKNTPGAPDSTTTRLRVYISSNGTSANVADNIYSTTSLGTDISGAWHHVRCTFDGSAYKFYWNGSLVLTIPSSLSVCAFSSVSIGGNSGVPAQTLAGYVDSFRLTSVVRNTGDFTVPTQDFPTSGNIRINGRIRSELESVRGGLVSYQKHDHAVLREGYGFNYGYYYGGQ